MFEPTIGQNEKMQQLAEIGDSLRYTYHQMLGHKGSVQPVSWEQYITWVKGYAEDIKHIVAELETM